MASRLARGLGIASLLAGMALGTGKVIHDTKYGPIKQHLMGSGLVQGCMDPYKKAGAQALDYAGRNGIPYGLGLSTAGLGLFALGSKKRRSKGLR